MSHSKWKLPFTFWRSKYLPLIGNKEEGRHLKEWVTFYVFCSKSLNDKYKSRIEKPTKNFKKRGLRAKNGASEMLSPWPDCPQTRVSP